jgi:hypothetical protein
MRSVCVFVLLLACGTPAATTTTTTNHADAASAKASKATLAVLEPDGDGCVLRRIDPIARTSTDLARVPVACLGARVSWRHDLQRAVVWFDPSNLRSAGYGATNRPNAGHSDETIEITERRYELDLVTHEITTLVPPENTAELGYDSDGTLLAFVERDLPNAKGMVTVEGRVLDFTQIAEGMPAAALTYRRSGATWQLADVVATTTGWDYARGWSAAPAASRIGPRSAEQLEAHAYTTEITDVAIRAQLDRIAPKGPDGDDWAQLASTTPIYVWLFNAEFVSTTGRIAWRTGTGLALLPDLGFTAGELVAIATRDRYLLVAGAGAGTTPRLYDLVAQRLVYASETSRAVTFWPRPSSRH